MYISLLQVEAVANSKPQPQVVHMFFLQSHGFGFQFLFTLCTPYNTAAGTRDPA